MKVFIGIILAVAVLYMGHNVMMKNDPPAACQLIGGNWSVFTGWHCG
jgi:hypothetical protein